MQEGDRGKRLDGGPGIIDSKSDGRQGGVAGKFNGGGAGCPFEDGVQWEIENQM